MILARSASETASLRFALQPLQQRLVVEISSGAMKVSCWKKRVVRRQVGEQLDRVGGDLQAHRRRSGPGRSLEHRHYAGFDAIALSERAGPVAVPKRRFSPTVASVL